MGCRRYRKKMYLYKPDELTRQEIRQLGKHFQGCKKCSSEAEGIGRFKNFVEEQRKREIQAEKPMDMTSQIIREIESDKGLRQFDPPGGIKHQKPYGLFVPKIQLALILFITVLLGVFMVESAVLLKNISNLETQMALKSSTPEHNEPLWFKKAFLKRILRNIESSVRLWEELPGNKIVIDKNVIEELLLRIRQIPDGKQQQLEEMLFDFPHFQTIFRGQKLRQSEYFELLQKKEDILKVIERL